MNISLKKGFRERVSARFEKYNFEVGVLEDKSHKTAQIGKRGLKGKDVISIYAGVPIRKATTNDSGLTISQVSAENRKRMGFNYLKKPFERKTDDIIKFATAFFKMAIGARKLPSSSSLRRCENLLQAIVRNPILRGDYGPNSNFTIKLKGFDRYMIDTAQLFKAIKARATVKNV
jgi:hypothetical protein